MQTGYIKKLTDVPADVWNAMVPDDAPFLRHEFLSALEETGCVSEQSGWIPHHIVVVDDEIDEVSDQNEPRTDPSSEPTSERELSDVADSGARETTAAVGATKPTTGGSSADPSRRSDTPTDSSSRPTADGMTLLGAMPFYLKFHSYGEYIFDWAWADAYDRAGLNYYPKLLCSVPFTPVTGPRLLVNPTADQDTVKAAIVQTALSMATEMEVSSAHFLFTDEADTAHLAQAGLMTRTGSQFHWGNDNYASFDDYLAALSSKRRKNVRRERRRVVEQGIEFDNVTGSELTEEHWDTFYRFYRATIDVRGASAYLSKSFFKKIGETMSDRILLTLARHDGKHVAGALNLIGDRTLYGRYWGSTGYFDDLHFETCYYQGIDYCIANGLQRFEAGAQGEHKLNRGLLPVKTWSAHWISHPQFADAIGDFLDKEKQGVSRYVDVMHAHTPFRKAGDETGE